MNFKNWNANVRLAVVMAVALLIWVASGLVSIKKEQQSMTEKKEKALFTVQVQEVSASSYQKPVYIRGRTEANRTVSVAAEIDGKVIATPTKEGAFVEEGAVLCRLDDDDRPLQLEQARTAVRKAELDYQGALKLKDGGYQSASQIATAKSNLAMANSLLKSSELAIERLVIRAPFAGIVETRMVDAGAFVQRGTACAKMLELSPLLVTGQVSEKEMVAIKAGSSAKVTMADGRSETGFVRYVSQAADPSTRTFRVDIEIKNEQRFWADGMSAQVIVYTPQQQAHLIPPSLLALKDEGVLGVKVIEKSNGQNLVNFPVVSLIGDDPNGVWVGGLADTITLITVGQEYVAEGQKVEVVQSVSMNESEGSH